MLLFATFEKRGGLPSTFGHQEIMNETVICSSQPEEIASAVLCFCSTGASFLIGHALAVDGRCIFSAAA
jgi:hypothetical protein